ncbi:MAG: hypothetical protein L3J35_03565 [Bacteroidales bacterium]|nr:hypothetical protein [Bacteroidales bacterium]
MKIFNYILIIIIYMSADFVKIPSYSLSPDKITLYERVEWLSFSEKQLESFKNLENREKKYNDLSDNARKRLLRAVNNMIYLAKTKEITGAKKVSKQIADNEILIQKEGRGHKAKSVKYKLTFITLTLSSTQVHTDKEITKSLLGGFLDSLRRKWKVDQYIWKAEKQENGNIHYHILTNKFIHWKEIREVWNRIQNKPGFNYVDRYSEKMRKYFKKGFKPFPNDKRSEAKQREAYEINKKNNWTNPNSTDIHALYKVKNIAGYIVKYVAKGVTKTKRTERIDELLNNIEDRKNLISHLSEDTVIYDYSDTQEILEKERLKDYRNRLNAELKQWQTELKELKEKGVTGRIWGQSQILSKIKPYSDVESFNDIPEIKKVDKIARFKHEFEISANNIITTMYFDITKTPHLKQLLDNHIYNCITNTSEELNFDSLEQNFENSITNEHLPPAKKINLQTEIFTT